MGHHDPVDGNLGVRGLQMQFGKMGELPPWKLTWHWKPIVNKKFIFIHGGFSIVMLVLGGYTIFSYGFHILQVLIAAGFHVASWDDLRGFHMFFLNLRDLGSNGSRSRSGTAIDMVSELNHEKVHWKVFGWVKTLSFITPCWPIMNMYIDVHIYIYIYVYMHMYTCVCICIYD